MTAAGEIMLLKKRVYDNLILDRQEQKFMTGGAFY
jgi:hypothetical protein